MTFLQTGAHFILVCILSLLHLQLLHGLDVHSSAEHPQDDKEEHIAFTEVVEDLLGNDFGADRLDDQSMMRKPLQVTSAGIKSLFDGDFEAWLAAVLFKVPDDALPPSSYDSLQYQLQNLVCTNVQLGTTEGEHPRRRKEGGLLSWPASGSSDDVRVQMQRVTVQCTGTIKYSWHIFGGDADVKVSTDSADLSVAAYLGSSDSVQPKVPDSMVFTGCKLQANLVLEVPGGSFWTKLVRSLPGVLSGIQDALNGAMQDLFCKQLLDIGKKELNSVMGKMHNYSHEQISIPAPTLPPWNDTLLSWDDVPFFHWVERLTQIIPEAKGTVHNILGRIFPLKRACLLSTNGDRNFCFSNKALCVIGDDADKQCLVHHALNAEPPAVMRWAVLSANATFTHPNATILEGNQSSMRSRVNDTSMRLSLATNLSFNGTAGGATIQNLDGLLDLEIVFDRLDLAAEVFAALDADTFWKMRPENYIKLSCMQDAMRLIKMSDISVQFGLNSAAFSFSQKPQYSSPLLSEGVQLIQHLFGMVKHYDLGMNAVLRGLLLNASSNAVDSWVSGLPGQSCPKPKGEDQGLIDPTRGAHFNFAALGVTVLAIIIAIGQVFRGSKRRAARELLPAPEEVREKRCPQFWFMDSLCMSASVPYCVAGAWPLCLIACTFLFAGSNFLFMAESVVDLELGKEGTVVYEIMPYSLLYSIHSLINDAHLPLLAYVLMVFSGFLPYTKLLCMFLMWFMPSRAVSRKWRGRCLLILDQIGKYSLVDVFVIQFINGSLFTTVQLSPKEDTVNYPLLVAVRTKEEMGFFAFVMATVASLILGHVILHYHGKDPSVKADHRKALLAEVMSSPEIRRRVREARTAHDVERAISGRERRWVGPVLVALLALLILSFSMPAFTVKMHVVEQEVRYSTYSMFEWAFTMQDFSLEVAFGTVFSQFSFILFALSTICLHVMILLVIWYAKIPPAWWRALSTVAHTLCAWSALDVMVISMALTLIEMQTTNFVGLSGDQMSLAGKLLGTIITDSHGVRLGITLEWGTWLIFFVSLVHAYLGRVVMGMLERAVVANDEQSLGSGSFLAVESESCGPELANVIDVRAQAS